MRDLVHQRQAAHGVSRAFPAARAKGRKAIRRRAGLWRRVRSLPCRRSGAQFGASSSFALSKVMGGRFWGLAHVDSGPNFAPVSLAGAFVWSYRRLKPNRDSRVGARIWCAGSCAHRGRSPICIRPRACCRSRNMCRAWAPMSSKSECRQRAAMQMTARHAARVPAARRIGGRLRGAILILG